MTHDRKITVLANLIVYCVIACVAALLLWLAIPLKTIIVPAGFTGVPIDNPWFFGKEGVRKEVKSPGRHWEWNTTDFQLVPSTPIRQIVDIDDFTTSDNYRVDFSSSVIMLIKGPSNIVSDWTMKFWSTSIESEYKALSRQAVKPHTLNELMGNATILSEIDTKITNQLREFINTRGIPVEVIGVALGQAKPNKAVFDQIEETARVVEEKRTYTEKAQAETQRKNSESNRAAADNAYRNALGMSTTEYVTLQVTKMQTEACIKASQCVIGIDRIVTDRAK